MGDKKKSKTGKKEMTMDELDKVTGGINRIYGTGEGDMMSGTDGSDSMRGQGGDDVMQGGAGNDTLRGGGGSDALLGGDGNDILDGGNWDDANDFASGGEGDDSYLWRVHGEGNDVFVGGVGNDSIRLWNVGPGTLEDNWENGGIDITLTDANGNPVQITSDMFDSRGNLNLPPETSGVITGPQGDTLTFEGVERIQIR